MIDCPKYLEYLDTILRMFPLILITLVVASFLKSISVSKQGNFENLFDEEPKLVKAWAGEKPNRLRFEYFFNWILFQKNNMG